MLWLVLRTLQVLKRVFWLQFELLFGFSGVTQLKNCLVSLEALEVELVPAVTAIALDKSLESLQYAVILKNFWLRQAKTLQDAVYFIIDPTAFSNVSCLH